MVRTPGRQHGTGTAWSTLLRAVQGTQGRGGRRSVRPSASPQRQAGIRTRDSRQRGSGPRRGQTLGSRGHPAPASAPCGRWALQLDSERLDAASEGGICPGWPPWGPWGGHRRRSPNFREELYGSSGGSSHALHQFLELQTGSVRTFSLPGVG